MVTTITTLGRSGLQDWLFQRVSALILFAYFAYLDCGFFLKYYFSTEEITYGAWIEFADSYSFKFFTFFAVVNLVVHAWIGMWTVSTDYTKSTFVRISFQIFMVILFLAYIAWTFQILWGS